MTLENKNAVIYGVGGSIGGAVARAFAAAGASVFLSGRTIASVQQVADDIIASGGRAEAATVDAMDEDAVNDFVNNIVKRAGTIDISFNSIGIQDVQNIPLVEMSVEDFTRPVNIAMQSQFITATAAGRLMLKQGSGVILTLTATPGGIGYAMAGGFGPACCAIESLVRGMAAELGPGGVRMVNIRSAGSPDSRPFREVAEADPEVSREFLAKIAADTMLKKLPMMADIAGVAVFLVSDMASMITGVTIDVTAGTTSALNYKMTNIPFLKNISQS